MSAVFQRAMDNFLIVTKGTEIDHIGLVEKILKSWKKNYGDETYETQICAKRMKMVGAQIKNLKKITLGVQTGNY